MTAFKLEHHAAQQPGFGFGAAPRTQAGARRNASVHIKHLRSNLQCVTVPVFSIVCPCLSPSLCPCLFLDLLLPSRMSQSFPPRPSEWRRGDREGGREGIGKREGLRRKEERNQGGGGALAREKGETRLPSICVTSDSLRCLALRARNPCCLHRSHARITGPRLESESAPWRIVHVAVCKVATLRGEGGNIFHEGRRSIPWPPIAPTSSRLSLPRIPPWPHPVASLQNSLPNVRCCCAGSDRPHRCEGAWQRLDCPTCPEHLGNGVSFPAPVSMAKTASARTLSRKTAIGKGLVPKARRAFPLFYADFLSKLPDSEKGTRPRNKVAMSLAAAAWRAKTPEEKSEWQSRSQQEFAVQRINLQVVGAKVRKTHNDIVQDPEGPGAACPPMEAAVQSGLVVGDYVILKDKRKLGQGGYGFVARSRCRRTGKLVAVKLFMGDRSAAHAAQELAVYGALVNRRHDGFLELLAHGSGAQCSWIALPMMPCSTASHVAAHGPLTDGAACAWAVQVGGALEHMHKKLAVMHLDIKPGNVLWDHRVLRAALVDFSLATPIAAPGIGGTQRPGEYCTAYYRPPELSLAPHHDNALASLITPAVDMWSLGCSLAEVASDGLPLFPAEGNEQLRRLHRDWCKRWHQRQDDRPSKFWKIKNRALRELAWQCLHPKRDARLRALPAEKLAVAFA